MAYKTISTVSDSSGDEIVDICGLWEVIRIYKDDDQKASYSWIKDSFKFNFLSEMLFLCLRDGKTIHGSWELVEKTYESQKRYSIILNESFEFIVIDISDDQMILFDQGNYYLLIRRP